MSDRPRTGPKLDPRTSIRGPLKFMYGWRGYRPGSKTVLGLLGERSNPTGYSRGRAFLAVMDGIVRHWGAGDAAGPGSK